MQRVILIVKTFLKNRLGNFLGRFKVDRLSRLLNHLCAQRVQLIVKGDSTSIIVSQYIFHRSKRLKSHTFVFDVLNMGLDVFVVPKESCLQVLQGNHIVLGYVALETQGNSVTPNFRSTLLLL